MSRFNLPSDGISSSNKGVGYVEDVSCEPVMSEEHITLLKRWIQENPWPTDDDIKEVGVLAGHWEHGNNPVDMATYSTTAAMDSRSGLHIQGDLETIGLSPEKKRNASQELSFQEEDARIRAWDAAVQTKRRGPHGHKVLTANAPGVLIKEKKVTKTKTPIKPRKSKYAQARAHSQGQMGLAVSFGNAVMQTPAFGIQSQVLSSHDTQAMPYQCNSGPQSQTLASHDAQSMQHPYNVNPQLSILNDHSAQPMQSRYRQATGSPLFPEVHHEANEFPNQRATQSILSGRQFAPQASFQAFRPYQQDNVSVNAPAHSPNIAPQHTFDSSLSTKNPSDWAHFPPHTQQGYMPNNFHSFGSGSGSLSSNQVPRPGERRKDHNPNILHEKPKAGLHEGNKKPSSNAMLLNMQYGNFRDVFGGNRFTLPTPPYQVDSPQSSVGIAPNNSSGSPLQAQSANPRIGSFYTDNSHIVHTPGAFSHPQFLDSGSPLLLYDPPRQLNAAGQVVGIFPSEDLGHMQQTPAYVRPESKNDFLGVQLTANKSLPSTHYSSPASGVGNVPSYNPLSDHFTSGMPLQGLQRGALTSTVPWAGDPQRTNVHGWNYGMPHCEEPQPQKCRLGIPLSHGSQKLPPGVQHGSHYAGSQSGPYDFSFHQAKNWPVSASNHQRPQLGELARGTGLHAMSAQAQNMP